MRAMAFHSRFRWWVWPLLLLLAAAIAGCIPNQFRVPIQVARLSQIETYEVELTLEDVKCSAKDTFDDRRECLEEAHKIFAALIGEPNWDNFLKRYGPEDLVAGLSQIRILGRTILMVSPDPSPGQGAVDRKSLLEGGGRFFVIRKDDDKEEGKILLAGDSSIDPQVHEFNDHLLLRVRYIVSRIPGHDVYFHQGSVDLKIKLKNLQPQVYRISYEEDHEVYLCDASAEKPGKEPCKADSDGKLTFLQDDLERMKEIKIVDQRGERLLRRDYSPEKGGDGNDDNL